MTMRLSGVTALLSLAQCLQAQTAKPVQAASDPEKWQLEWHDEFDYSGLPDEKNWSFENGFVRNQEAQYYTTARLKNARVENGSLVIESHKENFTNNNYSPTATGWAGKRQIAEYTSASVITRGKQTFLYGRIEVRAIVPKGVGSWPAAWMVGTSTTKWPDKGEIDIMEMVGFDIGKVFGTVHAKPADTIGGLLHISKGDTIAATPDVYKNYHLYAIEWYPDRVEFFFDATHYFTYVFKDHNIVPGTFNQPFYLILNNAIGGSWGGQKGIDNRSLPQRYLIDYVRYFKRKEQ